MMGKEIHLTGKASNFSGVVLKAAARGDLKGVTSLVKRNPAWVQQVGPHGRIMLWEAAYQGHLAVVEFLLDCGAELDQPACYYTPMLAEVNPRTAALLRVHTLVAQALEKRGAGVGFHDACYLGDESFVRTDTKQDRFIVLSRKPRTSDPSSAMPIFYAVAGVKPKVVKALLEIRPKMQARDGLLLRWAAWRGNMEIVDQLLTFGANPNESGINDWALDSKLMELARRHGHSVDIDAPNWLGFPAIVDACRGNHNQPDDPDRVRRLLAAGATVNVKDAKGKTAFHRAAQAGFTRIASELLQVGANVNEPDANGESSLFDAVRAGRVATVMLLLHAGADVHVRNHQEKTASDLARRLRGPERDVILDLVG
ncbi:MAG: ankyrin repeat domain-containing protein [Thermoguttaceae bacterium]|jgi:ankyrin repeat protein